jgi:hypothetical protein
MAFRRIDTTIKKITPEVAKTHYALPHAPFERPLVDPRVEFLKAKALSGLAIPFMWAIGKIRDDNGKPRSKASSRIIEQVLRINGQHSSFALKELGEKLPENLVAVITTYELDSIQDAALCFAQHDHRISTRSIEDVWGAFKDTQPILEKIDRKVARKSLEGYIWYERKLHEAKYPDPENLPAFFFDEELHPWFLFSGEVLRSSDVELLKAPILAAMYSTFQADEEQSRKFWMEVARGNVYAEEDDPAKVLSEWYQTIHPKDKRPLDVNDMSLYRGAIFAWGAFRSHRSISKGITYKGKGGLPEAM